MLQFQHQSPVQLVLVLYSVTLSALSFCAERDPVLNSQAIVFNCVHVLWVHSIVDCCVLTMEILGKRSFIISLSSPLLFLHFNCSCQYFGLERDHVIFSRTTFFFFLFLLLKQIQIEATILWRLWFERMAYANIFIVVEVCQKTK